jgi:hypothetical protein
MFDLIESRINAAAKAKFANAVALIDGLSINGVFDDEYDVSLDFAEGNVPVFTCLASEVAGLVRGVEIEVTYHGVTKRYAVGVLRPDGSGMLDIVLEEI